MARKTEAKKECKYSKKVAARIRETRERSHFSQKDLVRHTGLSQQHISSIENARTGILIDRLGVVCEALGVPLSVLLCDDAYEELQNMPAKHWSLLAIELAQQCAKDPTLFQRALSLLTDEMRSIQSQSHGAYAPEDEFAYAVA